MVVVLPDRCTDEERHPGGAAAAGIRVRDDEQFRDLGSQEGSDGFDAGRPLAADGLLAASMTDRVAVGQVGGEQRLLEFVQGGVVDGSAGKDGLDLLDQAVSRSCATHPGGGEKSRTDGGPRRHLRGRFHPDDITLETPPLPW